MTCVECGAAIGSARTCGQCGAPVPELPWDETPAAQPVIRQAARWPVALRALGWTVGIAVNLYALIVAIGLADIGLTEASPAQDPADYIPLPVCAFLALFFAAIPAISVAVVVRVRRKRRAGGKAGPDPARPDPARKASLRQAIRERQRSAQEFARQCDADWADFPQRPGTRLWWVPAGVTRRELRGVDRLTVASVRYGLPVTVSAGGRAFTRKRVTGASWPQIAQLAGYSPPPGGKPWAMTSRRALRLRELRDEAGMPVLYISGRNYNRSAGARITFPNQRSLTFPVRGSHRGNAIMTAVDRDGNEIARYRLNGRELRPTYTMEITVDPGQPLTEELILAIVISGPWLISYFDTPAEGGG